MLRTQTASMVRPSRSAILRVCARNSGVTERGFADGPWVPEADVDAIVASSGDFFQCRLEWHFKPVGVAIGVKGKAHGSNQILMLRTQVGGGFKPPPTA